MRTLQIVNKLNELLYLGKSDKTIYWDRDENLFHIVKGNDSLYRTDDIMHLIYVLVNFFIEGCY